MLKSAACTSTKTGVAPTSATASAVAVKVKSGTMTALPGPMPLAIRASWMASVPLPQLIAKRAPQKAASFAAKEATSGPEMKAP